MSPRTLVRAAGCLLASQEHLPPTPADTHRNTRILCSTTTVNNDSGVQAKLAAPGDYPDTKNIADIEKKIDQTNPSWGISKLEPWSPDAAGSLSSAAGHPRGATCSQLERGGVD